MRVLSISLLVTLAFAAYAQAPVAPNFPPVSVGPVLTDPVVDDQLLDNQNKIWLTTIIGVVASIITALIGMYRERRQQQVALQNRQIDIDREERKRQWDLEDRRLARERNELILAEQTVELKRQATLEAEVTRLAALKVKEELAAAALRQEFLMRETEKKIDHNTDISKRAFDEANHVNQKLKEIAQQIQNVKPTAVDAELHALTQETHDRVEEAAPAIAETLNQVRRLAGEAHGNGEDDTR